MIYVMGEKFSCQQVTESFDNDPIAAYTRAVEMSTEHDMDFVILIVDGIPTTKFVDGKESK